MALSEILSYMNAIEKDSSLSEEKRFDKRMEVIDFIEFQIIDRIEGLLQKTDQPELNILKLRAEKSKAGLEEFNDNLFKRLRKNIRTGQYTGGKFRELVREYININLDYSEPKEDVGYDNLDIFINGLLSLQAMPEQTKDLEPEMVYYQKTPARIIFELAERVSFTEKDVFFDLGSGLGQVAILVNLLTGATIKGIEFEPAFCEYANACTESLSLLNATFINIDARNADYSEGTIFFMYTPFEGKILQEVLDLLQEESKSRKIKICTYGPYTARVALQGWLEFAPPKDDSIYKLGIFTSR